MTRSNSSSHLDSSCQMCDTKAKLILQGFTQKMDLDFKERLASVSKQAIFKILQAWVAAEDVEVHQLDIKAANLNDNLQENVCGCQPEGCAACMPIMVSLL